MGTGISRAYSVFCFLRKVFQNNAHRVHMRDDFLQSPYTTEASMLKYNPIAN